MLPGNKAVAKYIREETWDHLPQAVQLQAKLCALDLLGAIIAGSQTHVSKIMAAQAREHWPGDAATILLSEAKASLPGAVLANAFTANALDIDDGYRDIKGHPGAVVFPAILAAAEKEGASGKELLTALVVAYEVAIRAGLAWHDYHAEYHGSGSWGALGAAAGVARIMKLRDEKIIHALGTAEYHAPIMPMMRCIDYPAMTKDGIGWGSMVGTVSTLMAEAGFTGIPSLFGLQEYRYLVDSLGRDYKILNLYFKPYACCRWAQPAVGAALKMRKQHDLDPQDIEQIIVHTFEAATKLWLEKPQNTEEAQYNMAYPIAAALLEGEVGPGQVLDENLHNQEILDLSNKVKTVVDDNCETVFPAKCQCRLELALKDGTKLDSGISIAVGDPEKPMGEEGIYGKFRWLAGYVLDAEKSDSIIGAIQKLDRMPGVRPLIEMLSTS